MSPGTDTADESVQLRRFDSQGSPLGADFQVNTYTTGEQDQPRVGSTPDGTFVVVWRSDGSPGTDDGYRSIQGRLFEADGMPIGNQFQVNSHPTGYEFYPDIAVRDDGAFLVTWSTNDSVGNDPGQAVISRRFDSLGIPEADDLQLNSYST